jgi:GTP cyclohydrolase I
VEHKTNEADALEAVRTLLRYIGENPEREGLADTPKRFLKAWKNEFFIGYTQNPQDVLRAVFSECGGYSQPVTMRDIPFYSHCEHHIVPIVGRVHIAYLPSRGVVGISKLVRLVDVFARRLQLQERFTQEICEALQEGLKPWGVAVCVEARHFCMSSRGVKAEPEVVTTAFSGEYLTDPQRGLRALQQGGIK